jgi:response regulator RpfG family c-di-GMP phosphodiesterase
MPRLPTDTSDPSKPSLPGTIPLPPRLRLVQPTQSSLPETGAISIGVREQLLRGKQLLLQLKELCRSGQSERLQQNLALLSLAMRSLQQLEQSPAQLEDLRTILDHLTHELNQQSQEQRRQQALHQRWEMLTEWIRLVTRESLWELDPVREIARQMQREYQHHAPALHWYAASPQHPSGWAAAHGLNSAQVLLRMMARPETLSQDLDNAVVAGLVHDVGMATLPVRLLAAQEPATPAARQQWRQHPVWTADHVRPALHPEEFEIAAAIAHHHERLDGSGYPLGIKSDQIGPLGRQLAAADAYAALCQSRPHRAALSPRAAIQIVLKEAAAGRLDTASVARLLPWGLAPVGSVVELSDGSLAEVAAWGTPPGLEVRPVLAPYPRRDRQAAIDLGQARQRHIVRVLSQTDLAALKETAWPQAS